MEVVRFPGAAKSDSGKKKNKKQRQTFQEQSIQTGSFEYTCPNCQTKHNFYGKGMIFYSVEFFCSNCGIKNKVSNPNIK